jgi:TPP-dependent pyruvate/acetoin dehydrogenase alpha subunit
VPRFRAEMIDAGVVTATELDALDERIRASVAAAAQRAVDAPEPSPGRARQWLHAGDEPHGYRAELDRGPFPPGVFADDPEIDHG